MTKKASPSPEPDILGSVISSALQAIKTDQTNFAKKIGMSRSGFNQIIRGKQSGANIIPQMLPYFPEEWQKRILAAWLHDAPPREYRHLVTVDGRDDGKSTKMDLQAALHRAGVPHFDQRRQELLEWFIRRLSDPHFADNMASLRVIVEKK